MIMTTELLTKCAFNMFVYEYSKLGWALDWCEEMFEVDYNNLKSQYIEMAKICFETEESA